MPLVVDTSAILPLAMQDEERDYSIKVLKKIATTAGIVPPIFWCEVWNAMWVNIVRRKRISAAKATEFLAELESYQLEVAALPPQPAVLNLCLKHGISAYDGSYLELAKRLNCPLATQDKKLQAACRSEGLAVFGD